MGLEEGAEKLGIPKKTMDHYLGLIRDGRKMHYDFNLHINKSIGKLHKFIKAEKEKSRTG